jgi:periplasmic copper chaperone A
MRATTRRGDDARPGHPRLLPVLLAALLAVPGCDGGGDAREGGVARDDADRDTVQPAGLPVAGDSAVAGLAAIDPWVRVAIMPDSDGGPDSPPVNSAAYLVLHNASDEDDALVAVESTLADTVELHTVSMVGGIMRMRAVEDLAVPAGGEAVLAPGGFHIMLIGLHAPLVEGDTAELTLRFRSGRTLSVTAPIRRAPPR